MICIMEKEKFDELLEDVKTQNEMLNEQNKELKEIISDLRDKSSILDSDNKKKFESELEFLETEMKKQERLQGVLGFLWRFQQVLVLVLLILLVVSFIIEK